MNHLLKKKPAETQVRYDVVVLNAKRRPVVTWYCYSRQAAERVAQDMRNEYPGHTVEIK